MTPAQGSYEARKHTAQTRLTALLDPQTELETRYVAWLSGWDAETVETITTMVERRVGVRCG